MPYSFFHFFTIIGGIIALAYSEALQMIVIGGAIIMTLGFIFLSAFVLIENRNRAYGKILVLQ